MNDVCKHGKTMNEPCAACIETERASFQPKAQTNIYAVVGDMSKPETCIALEATNDVIIAQEDPFRTGYECKTCDGACYIDEPCSWCKGSGREADGLSPCRVCCKNVGTAILDGVITQPGKKVCPDCDGRGGLVITPQEASDKRPSTGVVLSVGPMVQKFAPGMRILYTLFSGQGLELGNKKIIRVLREHEILARIHGLGKVGDRVR